MKNLIKWWKDKKEEHRKIKYYREITKMFEVATQERLLALETIKMQTDFVKWHYGLDESIGDNISKGNKKAGVKLP